MIPTKLIGSKSPKITTPINMTDEQIEKAADEYAIDTNAQRLEAYPEDLHPDIYPKYDTLDLAEAFENGANFALAHQWISVDERLPEEEAMVTAHSPNGRIDMLKYHDGEFVDELGQTHCVDYFIPIPKLNPEKQSK